MKVSEFWHNGRGPQLPQNIKNLQMGYFCNSFKYFLKFSTSGSNFSKKCKGGDFEVCGVIDQVDHGESEYEVKTGTGSSFRRHFGEKPIFWVFLGPKSPLLWGLRGRYLAPQLMFGD